MEYSQAPRACPGGRGPGEVIASASSLATPRSALPERLHRLHHALVAESRRPCPHRATTGARGMGEPPGALAGPSAAVTPLRSASA
eukprot:12585827-Alexandrium_andersonii.AAC.1